MRPLCHYCGQAVWGQYVNAMGATWHPEHFLCAGCGKPLNDEQQFQIYQGQPYHSACYLTYRAPRCVYCQEPLSGRYLVDGWGNTFCKEHQTQYPACSFCGRLIPPQQQTPGWRLGGSMRCQVCRSTAIETAEQAQPLFTRLKTWVSQQGLRFNQLPLRLELRDSARLEQLLQGRTVVHPLGVTLSSSQVQQGGHLVNSRVEGVAVLEGMPATLFAGVVLHELGHVWLTVQGVEAMPLWAEEGFCQLLSHRYYHDLATDEARYCATSIEKDADPVYGEGFRRISALAEHVGFQALIGTLQTTRRLPRQGSV